MECGTAKMLLGDLFLYPMNLGIGQIHSDARLLVLYDAIVSYMPIQSLVTMATLDAPNGILIDKLVQLRVSTSIVHLVGDPSFEVNAMNMQRPLVCRVYANRNRKEKDLRGCSACYEDSPKQAALSFSRAGGVNLKRL